jgi:hypothetical protein
MGLVQEQFGVGRMNMMSGRNLIFVACQPRSGSSLLQLILAGNSEVMTTEEPWIALHPIFALKENGIHTVYNSGIARRALTSFLNQTGNDDGFYKDQLSTFLSTLYDRALEGSGKKRFLDKSPRYYLILEELAELFPEACFILLFRNPGAVFNSVMRTWVKNNMSLLGNHLQDLMTAPDLLTSFLEKHPQRAIRVHYENLVADPRREVERISTLLGLTFSENMIDFAVQKQPAWELGDQNILYYDAIEQNRTEKWIDELNSDETRRTLAASYIVELGRKRVARLGYSYDDILSALGVDTPEDHLDPPVWTLSKHLQDTMPDPSIMARMFFLLVSQGATSQELPGEVEDTIARLMQIKKHSTEAIKELKRVHHQLEDIETSISWKLVKKIRENSLVRPFMPLMKRIGHFLF